MKKHSHPTRRLIALPHSPKMKRLKKKKSGDPTCLYSIGIMLIAMGLRRMASGPGGASQNHWLSGSFFCWLSFLLPNFLAIPLPAMSYSAIKSTKYSSKREKSRARSLLITNFTATSSQKSLPRRGEDNSTLFAILSLTWAL